MDVRTELVLYVVAFVLAVVAAVAPTESPWFRWLPAAFAVFVLAFVVNAWERM